jgi:hypothetical protein
MEKNELVKIVTNNVNGMRNKSLIISKNEWFPYGNRNGIVNNQSSTLSMEQKWNIITLHDYLQNRSVEEGCSWELNTQFFETYFNDGIRKFFGVCVDNQCVIQYDEQEPNNGYCDDFIFEYNFQVLQILSVSN